MASTVWKGHLTFGLVSIPIKLSRAARAEKVSFRQLHAGTGSRVRQALVAATPVETEYGEAYEDAEEEARPARGTAQSAQETAPFVVPPKGSRSAAAPVPPPPSLAAEPREIARSEIVKGYEYARDQYVTLTREELANITPQTAREMQILEFVKLAEVDPIYFETSYYAAPDKGGERAYSLLFEALRQSGFVGLAQVAMHNREHVVVIRPGRHGIILHTMFYQSEIREEDEYRAATGEVSSKELDLALLLVRNLEAPFEPAKYHDSYREKIDALIQAKIAGEETVESPAPKAAPVVNILEALQRSLESSAGARKPPASEEKSTARPQRRKSGGKG
jgi:DNA end-binding protein Ku